MVAAFVARRIVMAGVDWLGSPLQLRLSLLNVVSLRTIWLSMRGLAVQWLAVHWLYLRGLYLRGLYLRGLNVSRLSMESPSLNWLGILQRLRNLAPCCLGCRGHWSRLLICSKVLSRLADHLIDLRRWCLIVPM